MLSTGDGRAELLLGPGVFLRLGKHGALRMLDTHLENATVEVNRGRRWSRWLRFPGAAKIWSTSEALCPFQDSIRARKMGCTNGRDAGRFCCTAPTCLPVRDKPTGRWRLPENSKPEVTTDQDRAFVSNRDFGVMFYTRPQRADGVSRSVP